MQDNIGEPIAIAQPYTLQHWVGGGRGAGFFSARGEDGEHALLKLVPEDHRDSERQLEVWERARQLRHTHVLDLHAVGRLESDGKRYIYAAFVYPDDRLASALEQAPLTADEARGLLDALLSALRYLHGQGLAHGALDPLHIVAIGDTVKLIPDSLRDAEGMQAYAEDVRQLGQLLRRVRAPQSLDEPLSTIARHACEPDIRLRWTLAEIAAALGEPAAEPPPVAGPPEPVAVPEPVAAPGLAAPAPERPPLPPPHVRRSTDEPGPRAPFPKWIFVAVGVLLLMILALNLRRKPDAVSPPQVPAPTPQAPGPLPAAHDSKAETARAAPPKAAPVERVKAPAATHEMWRLIAYTYGSYQMASKKAKQVNDRWPDLHAVVFVPGVRRGYYLVSLGGRMTRDDALRLRQRVRELGLPRDAYVQNYTE